MVHMRQTRCTKSCTAEGAARGERSRAILMALSTSGERPRAARRSQAGNRAGEPLRTVAHETNAEPRLREMGCGKSYHVSQQSSVRNLINMRSSTRGRIPETLAARASLRITELTSRGGRVRGDPEHQQELQLPTRSRPSNESEASRD